MDVVMFSLKRAFHKSIEAGLRLTEEFGLTPARFDLMTALHRRQPNGWARQCWLKEYLGVSAPTISRMVTSLERVELLVRLRDDKGRTCGVRITEKGKACLAKARHKLIDRGAARRMVRAFWPLDKSRNTRAEWNANLTTVCEVADLLHRMRRTLYDPAWLAVYEGKGRHGCG